MRHRPFRRTAASPGLAWRLGVRFRSNDAGWQRMWVGSPGWRYDPLNLIGPIESIVPVSSVVRGMFGRFIRNHQHPVVSTGPAKYFKSVLSEFRKGQATDHC